MAHPGGRPLAYTDPAKLQADIDTYFEENDQPTLAGLAYALGVARSTLYEYDSKEQFSDIIKEARSRVASVYEHRLIYGTQPTGVIFALKNMGWTDRTETDITSKGESIKPILGGVVNVSSNDSDQETPQA